MLPLTPTAQEFVTAERPQLHQFFFLHASDDLASAQGHTPGIKRQEDLFVLNDTQVGRENQLAKETYYRSKRDLPLGEPEVGRENQLNPYPSRLHTSPLHTSPLHNFRSYDPGRLQGRPMRGEKRIGGVEAVLLLRTLGRWASAAARGAFASACTQQV